MCFGITNSLDEFKRWGTNIEDMISEEPCVCFIVAYASFERFLYRTALALKIFQGKYSKDARKQLENISLESLVGYCSNTKQGGNPALRNILSKIGLSNGKIEAFRIARNNIVHGADIRDRTVNEESAKLLWEGLRLISDIDFCDKNLHPRAPYQAWQRLPMRRSKKHK